MATATSSLSSKIKQQIEQQEGISFPAFLEMALYHPEQGYYANPKGQVGRAGDFYTSVSVGPLYGRLLARRFFQWWVDHFSPESWRILEVGANDGQLAIDILQEMKSLSVEAWLGLEYAILEPLPKLRSIQDSRISPFAKHLKISDQISQFSTNLLPGIVFGNEVLDALPFHLVERIQEEWRELFVVSHHATGFDLSPREISSSSSLFQKLKTIPTELPNGYRTEIRTINPSFMQGLSQCIDKGLLLFSDYGFARPEYYDPSRTTGTIRTFSNHQAGEDPFSDIGSRDITAHVDFTDVAEAGILCGYTPMEFAHQGSYLTRLAIPMIESGAINDTKTINQFQSLTHPGYLGSKFHMMEMSKNAELSAQIKHRLALS